MEDPRDRALARPVLAQRTPKHPGDLVRPPGLVLVAQLEDTDDDLLACGERARKRAAALLDEARVSLCAEAAKPLVAGLAGDAVLPAERRDVRPHRAGLLDELQLVTHDSLLCPGHATVEQPKLCAMS